MTIYLRRGGPVTRLRKLLGLPTSRPKSDTDVHDIGIGTL